MASKAEEYRDKAREAETQAILARDPGIKRQLEQISLEWLRMSELARRHGW